MCVCIYIDTHRRKTKPCSLHNWHNLHNDERKNWKKTSFELIVTMLWQLHLVSEAPPLMVWYLLCLWFTWVKVLWWPALSLLLSLFLLQLLQSEEYLLWQSLTYRFLQILTDSLWFSYGQPYAVHHWYRISALTGAWVWGQTQLNSDRIQTEFRKTQNKTIANSKQLQDFSRRSVFNSNHYTSFQKKGSGRSQGDLREISGVFHNVFFSISDNLQTVRRL